MIKVLIVETDPMVRDINEKFLRNIKGYSLLKSVNNIEEAKELITGKKVDLILLDLLFPQGCGLELVKWIRSNEIKCDIILITADKSIESVEDAFRYGVVDYIIKPYKYKRFVESMNQYKARKSSFKNFKDAEQEIIDEIALMGKMIVSKGHCSDDSSKNVNEHTYNRFLDTIASTCGESFTAQEVAQKIGISRITARRYLEYLEKEQKVIIELEYGSVGRPKNKYRLLP